ncbi:MAG TPA: hypothetical protein VFS21_13505 [Roseiflexaceae bacterium]|nr:hypothetical protein [Roseiflexaceae bacterium]
MQEVHQALPPLSAAVQTTSVRIERGRALLIAAGAALAGLLLAIVWSFEVADRVLGATIADTALGTSARDLDLSGASIGLGLLFAFAAGMGATFTACNAVVFSCVAPLAEASEQRAGALGRTLGLMALGILAVTALYGMVGTLMGSSVPILSSATLPIGRGYPVRLAQSTVVFVAIGVVLLVWGAVVLGLVRNPLARALEGRPWLGPLGMGLLLGLLTVGRPFPLFRQAFEHAANTNSPLFGAVSIALQGLGNIVVMVLLLLLLTYGTGGRFGRWLAANRSRAALITAASLIVGGAFLVAYWGVRVPSYYEIGWFPHMPYR